MYYCTMVLYRRTKKRSYSSKPSVMMYDVDKHSPRSSSPPPNTRMHVHTCSVVAILRLRQELARKINVAEQRKPMLSARWET
jgi:hypothetical protein